MAPRKPAVADAPLVLNATAASILGFLEQGPLTGWDLAARLEDIIGDFWNVTRSQIYRELKILADHRFVASMKTGPRDRQPYKLTEAGRRAFRRWIAQPPGPPNMRIPLVLQVFFADALDPGDLQRSLASLRQYHEGRLAVYRGFEELAPKGSGQYDALRVGIAFQRMMIDWIDSMQKRRKGRA